MRFLKDFIQTNQNLESTVPMLDCRYDYKKLIHKPLSN